MVALREGVSPLDSRTVAGAGIKKNVCRIQHIVCVDQAIPSVPVDPICIPRRVASRDGALNVASASLPIDATANKVGVVAVKGAAGDIGRVCVQEQSSSIGIGSVVVKVARVDGAIRLTQIQTSPLLTSVEYKLVQTEVTAGAAGHLIAAGPKCCIVACEEVIEGHIVACSSLPDATTRSCVVGDKLVGDQVATAVCCSNIPLRLERTLLTCRSRRDIV